MRKMCTSVLFLLGMWSPAIADVAVMGAGTAKCSQYLDDVERQGNEARETYFQWALGFMSGINAKLLYGGKTTDLGLFPVDRQINALEQYCKDHPDEKYFAGIVILVDVLRQEQNVVDWRGE